jgi:curved DNA-binding protein CbpA
VVKAAYRALAFELHPDRNHGANGEKMKQLNSAYQSISKERGF